MDETQIRIMFYYEGQKKQVFRELNRQVSGMLERLCCRDSEVTVKFGNMKMMFVLDKNNFKGPMWMKECVEQ